MSRFWALEIQPGKLYTQCPPADLHLSQATLDSSAKSSQRTVVHCIVDSKTFAICSLRLEKVDQCSLDLIFDKNKELSFAITGQSTINLSGYFLEPIQNLPPASIVERAMNNSPFISTTPTFDRQEKILQVENNHHMNNNNSINNSHNGNKKVEGVENHTDANETTHPQVVVLETLNGNGHNNQNNQINNLEANKSQKRKEIETSAIESTPSKKKKIEGTPSKVPKTPNSQLEEVLSQTPVSSKTDNTPRKQLPNGLTIEDIKTGDGKEISKVGCIVEVKYIGKIHKTRKIFDASSKRPFSFKWGIGNVIKGWDMGLRGMKIGGRRNLIIPPSLAYGKTGSPPVIGANETLFFEIELMGVK